jgi:hypothetical protein
MQLPIGKGGEFPSGWQGPTLTVADPWPLPLAPVWRKGYCNWLP